METSRGAVWIDVLLGDGVSYKNNDANIPSGVALTGWLCAGGLPSDDLLLRLNRKMLLELRDLRVSLGDGGGSRGAIYETLGTTLSSLA